jgi:glycosyltransferase involved in cell wall biosynthesis
LHKINYITNLAVAEFSGGWSGMNHHVYEQLIQSYEVNLIEKVNPPYRFTDKLKSKILRVLGRRGSFPAYTKERLERIKLQVESRLQKDVALNFYHGVTPWLHVHNTVPYAIYLDAVFATYINIYHQPGQFSRVQLKELFQKETAFLKNAKAVFFSCNWALDEAKRYYQLMGDNFYVAGLGGGEDKEVQLASIEPYFLFTALDFLGKGGDKVIAAFQSLNVKFPQFSLKVAGQSPPSAFFENKKIKYEGYFDKSKSVEKERLASLFSKAWCFVLPTTKDITPLVLVEAGNAACPVISVDNFGIPEIVKHNETGMLIDPSGNLETQLSETMLTICSNRELRDDMGIRAAKHVRKYFNWDRTGKIICETLNHSLN